MALRLRLAGWLCTDGKGFVRENGVPRVAAFSGLSSSPKTSCTKEKSAATLAFSRALACWTEKGWGSGTASSFLRWLRGGRALRLSRRYVARGRCRPPVVGCAVAAWRAGVGAQHNSRCRCPRDLLPQRPFANSRAPSVRTNWAPCRLSHRDIVWREALPAIASDVPGRYHRSPSWPAGRKACSSRKCGRRPHG
eukprot:6178200-Pleurochrysis_carterae.AAC.4